MTQAKLDITLGMGVTVYQFFKKRKQLQEAATFSRTEGEWLLNHAKSFPSFLSPPSFLIYPWEKHTGCVMNDP